MVDFLIKYQSEIGLAAALIAILLFFFGVFRWLIFRNKPIKIEVANPEALAPPPRANLIEMTQREFIALTKEWRDQAYAERDKAHGAERAALEDKIADLNRQLANPEEALAQLHARILQLEETLDGLGNNISSDRITAAKATMERGDFSLADALFAEVEAREELAVQNTASAAFGRGEVAEAEIRWPDAAIHYARAAKLNETFENLRKASDFSQRSGEYEQAAYFSARLVKLARANKNQEQLSSALNEQALNLRSLAHYNEAEALFFEALEIDLATLGEGHPSYATSLNNLAGVVEAQGRFPEAEGLYRQALDITRATIGEGRLSYAVRNNLAIVVQAQGRFPEAEGLYRQALDFNRATIGERHPDYATGLNNLADVVKAQGRHSEAEGLCRQALAIDGATVGEGHLSYATRLNNLAAVVEAQGRYTEAEGHYRQALDICRATIGEGHPSYAICLGNLGSCLAAQGKPEEARTLLTQALAIFRATLPADHPHITETLNRIANLPTP